MSDPVCFGSLCSGIEAASVAFKPLGWRAAWFSEIDAFACAALAHHYPNVRNLGDMLGVREAILAGRADAPDVLCGGTPCQAFSMAGKRESLNDARGNLTLTFCDIADAIDAVRHDRGDEPCVVLWENVPGVLSTKDNAFGCFLGALAGSGAALVPGRKQRWTNAGVVIGPRRVVAWRTLDAQFFGLAQRRRRVFVVASARKGFDPAKVLFESEGVRRHPPARRGAGHEITGTISARTEGGGGLGTDFECSGGLIAHTLLSNSNNLLDETLIAFEPTQITSAENRSNPQPGDPCHTLAKGQHAPAIAFNARQDPDVWTERTGPLDTHGSSQALLQGAAVRRLMPVKCERLQGFADGYTLIPYRGKPAADGPRYKALGNSWAVPCAAWIGRRMQAQMLLTPQEPQP